jgi:hypothetical protein
MEARKNPEYLKSVAQAVEEFRAALVEFLELHVPNEGPGGLGGLARGIAPAVFPRDGADPEEIARLQEKVSRLAGRAAAAVPLTGISMGVQGVGVVDPITSWHTITRPKPLLEAPDGVWFGIAVGGAPMRPLSSRRRKQRLAVLAPRRHRGCARRGARPLDRPDPSSLANGPVSAASPIRNPPPRRQFC